MAKKSARSKGYRNYKKVEKGFTKQEIRTMIIGFAAIVIIIIGIIVVPDLLESRHLLKVVDGVAQAEDNWLVRDVSSTTKHKYRKIAEVNPAEGYELSSTEQGLTGDENEKYFYYTPVAEGAAQRYFAMAGSGEYSDLVKTSQGYLGMFAKEVLYQGDIVEEEIDGVKVAYYVVEYTMENAEQAEQSEDGEAEDSEAADGETEGEETPVAVDYYQTAYLYIDSPIDGNCVVLSAENTGDSDAVFADRDALTALLVDAAKNVTLAK